MKFIRYEPTYTEDQRECAEIAQHMVDDYWNVDVDEDDIELLDADDFNPSPFNRDSIQHQWFIEAYDDAILLGMELN